MSENNLRITIIQSNLHWEDVDANLQMFEEKISSIEDTDIILLPEMFSTGFSMKPELFAEEMPALDGGNGKVVTWMRAMAEQKQAVICGSVMIKRNEKFFNRLIWFEPNGIFYTYDKRHLFSMGDENNHYTAGTKKLIVDYKGWKICPLVCYDLRFPVWSRNTENYDLLFYVANWPERRIHAWKSLLVARAVENQCYTIGLNRVGEDGNKIYHSGDSSVIDMKGEILLQQSDIETVQTVALSKSALDDYRKEFPVLSDSDEFEFKM